MTKPSIQGHVTEALILEVLSDERKKIIILLQLQQALSKHKVNVHLYADDYQMYPPIPKGSDPKIKSITG